MKSTEYFFVRETNVPVLFVEFFPSILERWISNTDSYDKDGIVYYMFEGVKGRLL